MSSFRIKDIAKLAGVSTGTVDRILHNRGRVSEEALEKVNKVLKEINYQPNLIARSLALKKEYNLYTITPLFEQGEYWEKFCLGIEKAEREIFSYNVNVKKLYFDQYDKNSFDALTSQINKENCQGVVIATLFKESVLKLTKDLDKQGIPYIFVDAYIKNTNCISYYGTHSYYSGFIAGRLLITQIKPEEDIAIFRFFRKGDLFSTQVKIREEGFREYLSEQKHQGKIFTVNIHADNQMENQSILNTFFKNHPNVQSGIIFNSRAHLLGDYFCQKQAAPSFKLIGYDAIDANVEYLNSGHISHLIAQRPEVQGMNSIKALFRLLLLKEKPNQINYMPIDILIKENIQYYNNYI